MATSETKPEVVIHPFFSPKTKLKSSSVVVKTMPEQKMRQRKMMTASTRHSPHNTMKQKRRTLQTLQPSARTSDELVGPHGSSKQRIKKGKRKHEDSESCQKPSKAVKVESIIRDARVPVTIYHDATTASPTSPTPQDGRKVVTKDTLTTEIMDQEAHDLMVSENIPESYWQEVAEQRRMALELALTENEQLHNEVKMLKEENAALSEMAGQADYYASLFKSLSEDAADNTTSSDLTSHHDDTSSDVTNHHDDSSNDLTKADDTANENTSHHGNQSSAT